MANMTIRVDDNIKGDVEILFERLGMSVSGAINVFFRQAIREQALPFKPMIIKDDFITARRQAGEELKQAMRLIQEDSIKNGTDSMTMEEINAEIAAYRREKRKKLC